MQTPRGLKALAVRIGLERFLLDPQPSGGNGRDGQYTPTLVGSPASEAAPTRPSKPPH